MSNLATTESPPNCQTSGYAGFLRLDSSGSPCLGRMMPAATLLRTRSGQDLPPNLGMQPPQAVYCNCTLGRACVSLASGNQSSDSRSPCRCPLFPQTPSKHLQSPGAWGSARPALNPPPLSLASTYAETSFPFRIPAGAMAFASLPPTVNTSKNQVPVAPRAQDSTTHVLRDLPGEIS